jgi:hypothetical protein
MVPRQQLNQMKHLSHASVAVKLWLSSSSCVYRINDCQVSVPAIQVVKIRRGDLVCYGKVHPLGHGYLLDTSNTSHWFNQLAYNAEKCRGEMSGQIGLLMLNWFLHAMNMYANTILDVEFAS